MTMQNDNSRDVCANDVFLFLAGAGLGVGLGMLLAPKSGHETRQAIRGKVTDGKDYLARQGRDLTREVADRASSLADKASGLADKSRETLEKQRNSVSAAVDAGRQAYRETVSAL
jgi:gas vesicle protein